MPIDDILREQGAVYGTGQQQTQQQTQQTQQSTQGPRTIQLNLPDPRQGDQQSMMFWWQAIQTAILVYIAFRLG